MNKYLRFVYLFAIIMVSTGTAMAVRLIDTPPPLLISSNNTDSYTPLILDPLTGNTLVARRTLPGHYSFTVAPDEVSFRSIVNWDEEFLLVSQNPDYEDYSVYTLYHLRPDGQRDPVEDNVNLSILWSRVFSPNGQNLYFWTEEQDAGVMMLHRYDLTTGEVELLWENIGRQFCNVDRSLCVIQRQDPATEAWEMWALDTDHNEMAPVTTIPNEQRTHVIWFSEYAPRFAFYTLNEDQTQTLYAYDYNERAIISQREVGADWVLGSFGASWSPDGQWLAGRMRYAREEGMYMINMIDTSAPPVPLSDGMRPGREYTSHGVWSPVESRFAFSAYDNPDAPNYNLYIASPDGTVEQVTHADEQVIAEYDWSPNGEWMAYTTSARGENTDTAAYLLSMDGQSEPQRIAYEPHEYSNYICIEWRNIDLVINGKRELCETWLGMG